MTEKTILITGCSSGIGYAVAHGLKDAGWRVFASCRNPMDVDRLIGEGLECLHLDYDDPATLQSALDEILVRTGGTLDALFNNGAFALPGLVEDLPRDGLRSVFETNVLGYHDLTRRVLPVMRAQGHGRIVNNSSVLGFVALPWRGAYNASKFALEGLTDTLRLEMRGTGIHVCLIEPGPITSDIRRNSIRHFEKWIDPKRSARADEYQTRLLPRLNAPAQRTRFELPASAVTPILLRALTAQSPRAKYRITLPTKAVAFAKRLLPTSIMDRILGGTGS